MFFLYLPVGIPAKEKQTKEPKKAANSLAKRQIISYICNATIRERNCLPAIQTFNDKNIYENEKALKDSLNKKPLVDTEKFTLEPIDEDLTYWGGDIKMFFKDIELLPKEGYGIDVSKLEGIHLSNLSLPLIILGNDMIGDTYSIVEESYRLRFSFYISPFKSK